MTVKQFLEPSEIQRSGRRVRCCGGTGDKEKSKKMKPGIKLENKFQGSVFKVKRLSEPYKNKSQFVINGNQNHTPALIP